MTSRMIVVDAGALTLFFLGDLRVKRFFDSVLSGRARGFISGVNLSEYYYKTCQKLGRETAEARYYQVRRTLLEVVETDEEVTRLAGEEKCRQPYSLSLADCYALSLAKKTRAVLLTTDRELSKIRELNVRFFKT